MAMTILLLGKNGQVGWELFRALQPLGKVIALDRSINEDGLQGDINNFKAIEDVFAQVNPNVVVNATAYTAVDKAESETEQADLVNHQAVANLAQLCKKHHSLLIHYSTDYVFAGNGRHAWQEDDKTAPINFYGSSKRDGEIALEKSGVAFLNFRTSWVYARRGHNFIKTMLNLAESKKELNIIADQIGAPTGASFIADSTAQVLKQYFNLNDEEAKLNLNGHYHLTPTGETSWFDYAQYIFYIARKKGKEFALEKVNPINTSQYPTPAKRPLNSRLDTQKIQRNFGIHIPHWKIGVQQVLEEIL